MLTQVEIAALTSTEPYSDVDDIRETCQDILNILPKPINDTANAMNESSSHHPEYLQQESLRYNSLLAYIRTTLNELSNAIQGHMHIVSRLEEIYADIADDKVPHEWTKKSYPSKKPLASYIKDLLQRIAFFQKWAEERDPTIYWLSAFHFPQAFMRNKMRRFGKKYSLNAHDSIGFRFLVTKYDADALNDSKFDVNTVESCKSNDDCSSS